MRAKHYFMLGLGLQFVSLGLHGEIHEGLRGVMNGFGLAMALFCNRLGARNP